jgi:hypothetical protein
VVPGWGPVKSLPGVRASDPAMQNLQPGTCLPSVRPSDMALVCWVVVLVVLVCAGAVLVLLVVLLVLALNCWCSHACWQ